MNEPAMENELVVARNALAAGDFAHAAYHLHRIFDLNPLEPEGLDLADQLAARVEKPLDLPAVHLHGKITSGQIALRLHLLKALSKGAAAYHDEYCRLMAHLLEASGDSRYLKWVADYLDHLQETLTKKQSMDLLRGCVCMFITELDEFRTEFVNSMGRLREKLDLSAEMLGYLSIMCRRGRNLDLAVQFGHEGYTMHPCYMPALALGATYHESRNLDQALHWYQIATQHSDQVEPLFDVANMHLEKGAFSQAIEVFERGLEKAPEHPWGLPSLYYTKTLQSSLDGYYWRDKLKDYCLQHPDNERANDLNEKAHKWILRLLNPGDAFIDCLQKEFHRDEIFEEIELAASSIEAPSCYLVYQIEAKKRGKAGKFTVKVIDIPLPDPRIPLGEKDFQAWSYELPTGELTTDAHPLPLPPSIDVLNEIAEIAKTKYSLNRWSAEGAELAARLKVDKILELIGCLVHPPVSPGKAAPWFWVQRFQLAACLTIAHIDDGWENSLRRRVLASLLLGPRDWITGWAALALAEVARKNHESREEIRELFLKVHKLCPPTGHNSWMEPLCAAALEIPDWPVKDLEQFWRQR